MGLFDNGGSGGLSKPLGIALLALLAYRAAHGNQQQGGSGGGGLLGGLGGLLAGGLGGGGLGGLLGGLTQGGQMPQRQEAQAAIPEGLNGLIERFRQSGLGGIVDSWIGTGANRQIAPQQLNQALEPGEVDELSRQTGLPQQEVLSQLSQALPEVVDRLTPEGRVPDPAEMSRS